MDAEKYVTKGKLFILGVFLILWLCAITYHYGTEINGLKDKNHALITCLESRAPVGKTVEDNRRYLVQCIKEETR